VRADFHPIILVMAAGSSRRFGRLKQLADVSKPIKKTSTSAAMPMLAYTLEKLVQLPYSIVVATGPHHVELEQINHHQLDFHHCTEAHLGMGHTLAQATAHILFTHKLASHICIVLADQVALLIDDITNLLDLSQQNQNNIICCKTKTGLSVPSIFPRHYFQALSRLNGDKGAKSIIMANTDNLLTLSIERAAIDIDTQADLTQWLTTEV
jgi:molybdenum cofactor cytidylyltransferase